MEEAIHHREGAKCRKTAATFPWEALERTGGSSHEMILRQTRETGTSTTAGQPQA